MNAQKGLIRWARRWGSAFIEPRRMLGIFSLPRYFGEWKRYKQLANSEAITWVDSYPCLSDWLPHTPFDPHYFYQASWAARKLAQTQPSWHLDIGSSLTMIGVVSAQFPTMFIDCRPPRLAVDGILSVAGNILALPLPDGSVSSISCLHVLEHIGLGRYGEALDANGSVKAAQELQRVLAPGGRLLLSTPVGRQRVQFNAHRVFSPSTVVKMFEKLALADFALVDDQGDFYVSGRLDDAAQAEYACGMFEFVRSPE